MILFKLGSYMDNLRAMFSRWGRTSSSPPCLMITMAESTVIQCSKSVVFAPLWPRAVDKSSWMLRNLQPFFAMRNQRSKSNAICNFSSRGHPLVEGFHTNLCRRLFIVSHFTGRTDDASGPNKYAGFGVLRSGFRSLGKFDEINNTRMF